MRQKLNNQIKGINRAKLSESNENKFAAIKYRISKLKGMIGRNNMTQGRLNEYTRNFESSEKSPIIFNAATTATTAANALGPKKIKNLKNSNKNRPFTYQTKNGPIKVTYTGKNNKDRIILKKTNGSNHKEAIGKNANTILNKNIVFNA